MTDTRPSDSTEKPPRALFWPAFVITLLVGQATLWLGMLYLASTDPSFAVEPDYYQKGLRWNVTQAQRAANERLGWTLDLDISRPAGTLGVRALTVTLINSDGRPLDGASISVEAFSHSRASDRLQLELEPKGEGRYAVETGLRRAGLWEFRFTVNRGPETFTATEHQDVSDPEGKSVWRP